MNSASATSPQSERATSSRYINVKVNISEGQTEKIKKAVQEGTGVSIRLSHADLSSSSSVLALTQAQVNKITNAYQNGTGVTIKLSKAQLSHNVVGGFLPALLGFLGSTVAPLLLKTAATALPALATGALSSLASVGVKKALGSSLYLKKGDHAVKIVPAGTGLYLAPWQKGNSVKASGLYMKTGKGFCSGEGLLLGPDSPFKNIPILGMIL